MKKSADRKPVPQKTFRKSNEKPSVLSPEGPFFPSVLSHALEIERALRTGDVTLAELAREVSDLTLRGALRRGKDLAHRLGPCAPERNRTELARLIAALAREENGKIAPFEAFRARIERTLYGFVFTAHPTFSMTREQGRALAQFSADPDKDAESALARAFSVPCPPPDLEEETEHSLEAIGNLREGIEHMRREILETAEKLYPGRWTELRPTLTGVATWVGFDLDGRNDILWTGILARRFRLQRVQLEHYRARIAKISKGSPRAAREQLDLARRLLDTTLNRIEVHRRFFSNYNPDHDPGHEALQAASRALVADAGERLTRPAPLAQLLEKALATGAPPSEERRELVLLLAALRHEGLTPAEVHFRLNAAQIHNAIRKHVDLATHPADPRFQRAYMDRLLRRFRKMRPAEIHFGNVLEEQASARRMFMLIRQIVRHIDGHSPIRFLIAETESALTVMAALFLARRFGVEAHVDICPLFETEAALERGSRIVEHLLEIPEFVAYIRQRGRLCVQTGYSDAGRYIGQTAAAGSIERLKERILRAMDSRGLRDVALLFFDTHGESPGRGGHPGRLAERMDYVAPPVLSRRIAERGFSLIQESSWQGGDGFLWFMTPQTALAALTRVMNRWIGSPAAQSGPPRSEDPAYGAERTATTEFLTIVKSLQTGLMDSPDYGALLSVFGPNLMRAGGSRAIKRQHEGRRAEARNLEAREFRAIPHNAILCQMGLLANSVSGLGLAASADPAFFARMMESSPRFANVMEIALRSAALSDPDILESYVSTLDPALWLRRGAALSAHADSFAESCAAVASHLESFAPFEGLLRVFRTLYGDFTAFSRLAGPFVPKIPAQDRHCVLSLHAIRIALIHRIFVMAMEIPDYSPMHDIPRDELIELVFRLDIPAAMRELDEIFPVLPGKAEKVRYGEESDYRSEDRESYAVEHERIFRPIREMHALVQDISAALVQHAGFVG